MKMMVAVKILVVLLAVAATVQCLPSSQRSKERDEGKRGRLDEDVDMSEPMHTGTEGRRRAIVHRQSYAKSHHWGIPHRAQGDPCRFKRCYPGQKCVAEAGRAKCVCRMHCKAVKKPVCGIDGEYYLNRCEMHRAACLTSRDIYDARNRDCFYKQSECPSEYFLAMQASLLANAAGAQATVTTATSEIATTSRQKRSQKGKSQNHHKKKSPASVLDAPATAHPMDLALMPDLQATLDDDRVAKIDPFAAPAPLVAMPAKFDDVVDDAIPDDDAFVRVRSEVTFETTEETASDPLPKKESPARGGEAFADDIITNDARGDDVKRLFRSLDLDSDGVVGSEEIHEVTLMGSYQLGSSCTLYHLLHYADENDNGEIDIMELLSIFNVTVLHLDDDKRVLDVCANEGERLTLQCDIQGEAAPVWRRYNYDLRLYGDDGITVDGSLVYFNSVGVAMAGNYTCHARNRPEIFQVIRVSVFTPPKVEVFPRTQHRLVGDSVTVACHVTGVPPPHITWLINGEGMVEANDRYKILGNRTEIHINSAVVSDSAAYSCFATNDAGNSEEIAAVFIEEENDRTVTGSHESGAYFVFHDDGFLIATPRSCEVTRRVSASEEVPGLLRQNKLCRASLSDGSRRCNWSSAVAVGSRFVYAAQPRENRVVVVDVMLQRVTEVIATDPLPVTLHYVASTDQLFVLCWVDDLRDRSTLQVIYAASVPGTHSAAQIQPLDGGNRADFSVFTFFVPQEGALNTQSRHGFVAHKNQQTIYKLDLSTLVYDDDVIDLQVYDCVPDVFSYQPIGGQLHVTCAQNDQQGGPRSITVDYASNMVVQVNRDFAGYSLEHVSKNGRHVVRVFPAEQQLIVYNITAAGDMVQDVVLHTNFDVADVAFEESSRNGNAATVYVSSKYQGDLMYLNAATGSVEIIDNLSQPLDIQNQPYITNTRPLVTSTWYDRHIAVAGRRGVDIIAAVGNDVVCRLNDITGTSAVAWTEGEN